MFKVWKSSERGDRFSLVVLGLCLVVLVAILATRF
jgi:hypothetical protein